MLDHVCHQVFVTTLEELEAVQRKGEAARVTKATGMNDTSSRSHCIFTGLFHLSTSTDTF